MRKLLIGITGVLFVIFAGSAAAQDFIIQDNGSGSQNGINFQQNNQTNINQSNQMDVDNNVDASANTGGNSVNGGNEGSITTGDARVNVNIDNNLNHNWSDVGCCKATPTPKPGTTPTPGPTGGPTPTPTPKTGDGGKDGDGKNDGGGNGGGVGGGQVLGLSATSGEIAWQDLFYLGSGVCLLAARKFLHATA